MTEEGLGGRNMENSLNEETASEPTQPWLITQIFSLLITLISSYGWFMLILGIVSGFAYSKYKPTINEWKRKKEEDSEAAFYHKNPDLLLAREMAIENARKKLQERYDLESQLHAEKMRSKEEQKQKEKIALYEAQQRGEGRSLRNSSVDTKEETTSKVIKKKTSFRPEYNPMLGDGGSCSYRPSRRSGRQGG